MRIRFPITTEPREPDIAVTTVEARADRFDGLQPVKSVGHTSVGHLCVGRMNVGHMNVGQMSVGHMNVGQMSVGHMNVGQMVPNL